MSYRRMSQAERAKAVRKRRRLRAVGDAATIGGVLLFILFWLAVALVPTALMVTIIYVLLTRI